MEEDLEYNSEEDDSTLTKYKEYQQRGRVEFITFHPAYSYEEFVEGITVECNEDEEENLKYVLKPGIFKNICKRALGAALNLEQEKVEEATWKDIYENYQLKEHEVDFSQAPKYVLIIDEINRGDIAKILGELITLLEGDKRIGEENEIIVTLPYSNDSFGVPPNLYIIATMNTADRSIALIDVALRRRFGFIEMNPDFNILQKEHLLKNKEQLEIGLLPLFEKSIEAVKKINRKICQDQTIGRDKQIGHSFFFKVYTIQDLLLVWKYEILPLLEEYCYGNYQKINQMLFGKDGDTEWISESEGIKEIKNLEEMLKQINQNE